MTPELLRRAAVLEFARALVETAQNRAVHGRDSGHTEQSLVSLILSLQAATVAGVESPLTLQFSEDSIYHEGAPLLEPSLQAGSLLRELTTREVAALSFLPELTNEEANRLFDLLLLDQNRLALSRQHRDRALMALGIRNVRVTLRTPADPSNRGESVRPSSPTDLHRYQELATSLHDNHALAARDQMLSIGSATTAVEQALLRLEQEPSGLLSLAAQDHVDRFTVGHSVRVALLALQVARAAGANRQKLVEIGTAALLHDIGKSKVPQEVVFKRGRLDDDEWRSMAQHPRLGADILIEQSEFDPNAIGAAFCHHMRPDGAGYPHSGLPLRPSGSSCLIRVCDVFEALTSVRPYKRALTPLEAYAVMRRNIEDFDPRWFRIFVATLGIFPQGSRVRLDDGSMALVLRQGNNPTQPILRLLTGPAGRDLLPDEPDEVQAGQRQDGAVRRIAQIVVHDRTVLVPDPDQEDLSYLTQTAHGACLSSGHGQTP